jgi:hypothetical protein
MRIEWRRPGPAEPAWGVIFGAVLIAAAVLAALWLRLGLPRPACAFRTWTGLPCPTCGSARLVQAVLETRFVEALLWNPLVFATLVGLSVWAAGAVLARVLDLPRVRVVLGAREQLVARVGLVALVAANWVYLLQRGG